MYLICDLIVFFDKYIVFLGVVKMVEEVSGDYYIVGFWKSIMIYDLVWSWVFEDSVEKFYSVICY